MDVYFLGRSNVSDYCRSNDIYQKINLTKSGGRLNDKVVTKSRSDDLAKRND